MYPYLITFLSSRNSMIFKFVIDLFEIAEIRHLNGIFPLFPSTFKTHEKNLIQKVIGEKIKFLEMSKRFTID